MPSSWLKRRFNYIKRLSGFVSGSAKTVDESSANLGKNIKNDLNSGNRWVKDEKNAYRDYTKNRDQSFVQRNAAIDSKKFIDEEKKCNVNDITVRHLTPSDDEPEELNDRHDVDGSELCIDLCLSIQRISSHEYCNDEVLIGQFNNLNFPLTCSSC